MIQLPMRVSEGLKRKRELVGTVLWSQKTKKGKGKEKKQETAEGPRFHCSGLNWSSAAS